MLPPAKLAIDAPAEKDRTRAIRLRERRSAAGGGSDRDLFPGRRAGRGGAKREIPAANMKIINLLGPTG
jgi:hypothetical protein